MQHALAPDQPPITDIDYLMLGSGQGVGNLFFSQQRKHDARPSLQMHPFETTEDVMEVALDIDEGLDITPEKALFFQEGSATGGARPKTQIREGNKVYIAKFPRDNDLFNNTVAEYVSLNMARKAGINTAEAKLLSTVRGDVLLVERFDVDNNNNRQRLISAHSLSNEYTLDRMTAEKLSYPEIVRTAEQLNPKCNNGNQLSKSMYKRMLFNVAIGNTDDHMKNHAFVNNELSPCFDVNSNIAHGSHSISLSSMGSFVTQENLELAGKEMGLEEADMAEIANDVLEATEDWEEQMAQAGLSERDINLLKTCYAQRDKINRLMLTMSSHEQKQSKLLGISR